MGCTGCALKSNGGCESNGKSCGNNRKSVYNWLADLPEPAYQSIIPIEVSFKNGARKDFYQCKTNFNTLTGDFVVVEADSGYDIGKITMSGELVNFQMKKYNNKTKLPNLPKVIRPAKPEDISRLEALRSKEKEALINARVIARELGLNMKIGDVEYQGNGKKITIYYTSEERVDFRQLIKEYARVFRMRIEMRQIGMRQESSRIGGIGSCGRELCCSTWLNDFKSVNTSAARYQNLSINQTKLSGQCGRLKCCLNFELDTYLEAWKKIPKKVDKIPTKEGTAFLVKTDILRQILIYKLPDRTQLFKLTAEKVTQIKNDLDSGKSIQDLHHLAIQEPDNILEKEVDLVGHIELEPLKKRSYKGRKNRRKHSRNSKTQQNSKHKKEQTPDKKKASKNKGKQHWKKNKSKSNKNKKDND